ncbi:MAG: DUF3443 family protein [Proteobacteria bacterium]|nr:DUF3443 family protein [Pseudomonadota bacterium]
MRAILFAASIGLLCVAGCGGGGGGLAGGGGGGGTTPPTGSNVQSIVVDSGPTPVATSSTPAINTAYTTVTICSPGSTSNCQTIDHIQVDTGSSGLRILQEVLTITLPLASASSGSNGIAECTRFVDGSSWGSVRQADVKIGGESAPNQFVQVIGDTTYTVPSTCTGSSGNPTLENGVKTFGANGILGVAPFISDCGPSCSSDPNNGTYYNCPTVSTCAQAIREENLQVSNPVAAFPTDNNGVIIQLPSVAVAGTASVTGSLIFGVGTQSNNGLGSATVFNLDSRGYLATKFNTTTLHTAFIDSGSNGYFFPDSNLTSCPVNKSFWCPQSDQSLSATMVNPINNASKNVAFTVTNADGLFQSGKPIIAATSGLGGDSTPFGDGTGGTINGSDAFDWGLPFYYGKTVIVVIENRNTSAGMGPFFAF